MNLNIYNGIYLFFMVMGLTVNLVKYCERRECNYDFVMTFIAMLIELFLLWKGGFF